MDAYGPGDLEEILRGIDEEAWLELGTPPARHRVVVVGGSALMLYRLTQRPATHDIDVLRADAVLSGILSRYRMVNGMVAAHSDEIPYGFEDRLVGIVPGTRCVEYLAPSLEDLVVMKLYAWRPSDRADLESPGLLERLNWRLLRRLVYDPDEAEASALSERRLREMRHAFERYAAAHDEGGGAR